MRHFPTLLRHEIRALVISPATYIAAFLFLFVMGVIFYIIVAEFQREPRETAPASIFFELFFIPVFFMVPLLTMKCLAEEQRLGILETLRTAPISTVELVLAKFSASYLLYLTLWLSTLSFTFILHHFVQDDRLLDHALLAGGYGFIALSGLLFIALGVFSSSLTRSQLVAGILTFAFLFGLIIGSRRLADTATLNLAEMQSVQPLIDYLQIFQHAEDFARGVIDTRPIVFYSSGCALLLLFTILVIERKT